MKTFKQTMMKKIIIPILLGAVAALAGCEEETVPTYALDDQRINFWADDRFVVNPYPDELYMDIDLASAANLLNDELIVPIIVQTQGFTVDAERKVAIKVGRVVSGSGVALESGQSFTVAAGAGIDTLYVRFDSNSVRDESETAVIMVFDYENSDFGRGLQYRDSLTLNVSNYFKIENVNMTASLWTDSYEGYYGWGGPEPGYGIWSAAKGRFICKVLQTVDLKKDLPNMWTSKFNSTRNQLRTELEAYKVKSAADPDTYPPLYDDGTQTWIKFEEPLPWWM